MLRLAHIHFQTLRPLVAHRGQVCRSLVSPVLLTRTWENESIGSLRKEAKNRGLSPKGTKANLILRITEHDAQNSPCSPPAPSPANTRSTSSSATAPATTSHTVAPGPGVPASAATTAAPPKHELLNVVIPDLSQPEPQPPTDVPYVPDFRDSTAFEKQTPPVDSSEELPKVIVVGGLSTYHGDGPTHNLETVNESETVLVTTPGSTEQLHPKKPPFETGILEDITQDLGLPPPKELKQSFWRFFS
ncbi:hypothetical protein AN958_09469 [Leucoagaricus sp. SymC.cos]|nr:hypothetical protein AN958_09469 [Leucoagaricus sp. SymC.cos]